MENEEIQEELDARRNNVKRSYRILSGICLAAIAGILMLAVVMLVSAFRVYTGKTAMGAFDGGGAFALCNTIFPLFPVIPFEGLTQSEIASVTLGGSGLLLIFLDGIFFVFFRLFRDMKRSRLFFDGKKIRYLRILSAGFVIVGICQPVLWLPAVLLLAISVVFEYGQETEMAAEQTIAVQEEVILPMAEIVDGKSEETGQHIKRVSEYSKLLAAGMGLPQKQVERIRVAATLHDIGKLMIPAGILEKKGKLSEQEYEMVKQHVIYGEKMLHNANGEVMRLAARIALEHHERWDGSGYLHKKGEEISLEARIVATADVFDALCSRRAYKEAWSFQEAAEEIISQAGKQFGPRVVSAFQKQAGEIKQVLERYGYHGESCG